MHAQKNLGWSMVLTVVITRCFAPDFFYLIAIIIFNLIKKTKEKQTLAVEVKDLLCMKEKQMSLIK